MEKKNRTFTLWMGKNDSSLNTVYLAANLSELAWGVLEVLLRVHQDHFRRIGVVLVKPSGDDGTGGPPSDDGGVLNLYWGESKLYGNVTNAITDCLGSLAPYLRDELGANSASAQDLFLANEYADFTDPNLLAAFKRFFDPDDPMSQKLRLCGIALVGFDCDGFPADGESGEWAQIESNLKAQFPSWNGHVGKRVTTEKLETFDIHFIC